MQAELIEVMRDQVRTIYRTVTGTDLPDLPDAPPGPTEETPFDDVARRFVELEKLARADPVVAVRVPPFSFRPPIDAAASEDRIVVELDVPGVDRDDVTVGIWDGRLVISGFRRLHADPEYPIVSAAEIPRGPFYREFPVPWPVEPEPSVDLDRGVLRVCVTKASAPSSREQGQ